MEEKKNNRKKYIFVIVVLLAVFVVIGASFAYYSATVNKVNETNTKIQTNTLGLIYNGEKEINYQSMIPGDSFEKTFTVENTSNTAVTYNIYMQGITNQYNEDLVYTLYETDSNGLNPVSVVSETVLPETNANKWYLKTNINIAAAPTKKYYKLVIEYKYLANQAQNDYQGKVFNATLGIDTVQNASNPQPSPVVWQPTYYAFGTYDNPYANPANIPFPTTDLNPPEGKNVFLAMDTLENKAVCIIRSGDQHCFKINNYENESEHLQQVFSDGNCEEHTGYAGWTCSALDGECSVYEDGYVGCLAYGAQGADCTMESSGLTICN